MPDCKTVFPLALHKRLCFLKNIITGPNIQVGDYTYYDDFEDVHNFEKNVRYHVDFTGDKLIIGKFSMICFGCYIIMNGVNHVRFNYCIFIRRFRGSPAACIECKSEVSKEQ